MPSHLQSVRAACERVLIRGLPIGLRFALALRVESGEKPADLLREVRRLAGRRSYTALGVAALLHSWRVTR